MQKLIIMILYLGLLTFFPEAEEHQFIDGFNLDTGKGYYFSGLGEGMEDSFSIFRGDEEIFYATVLYAHGMDSFKTIILQTVRAEYSNLNAEQWDETISLKWESYAGAVKGFRVRLEFGGKGYQVFALDLRPTPGAAVSLLFFPTRDWPEARQAEELNLILQKMSIEFLEAAG